MLEKHKKLIEGFILNRTNEVNNVYSMIGSNNYSFEILNNELVINIDDNTVLSNTDNGVISIWNIKDGHNETSLIINKIDNLDVVAMIAIVDCNNNLANVTIKQTPTNMYISYIDETIGYDINQCDGDLIVNIIEDYFNKKNLLVGKNKEDIFKFIRIDTDEIFNILYNNKDKYINNLNRELNNLNASYVIESEFIKKKLKTISNYKSN